MAYGSSKVGAYEPIKRKTKKSETKNNGGIIGAAGYLAGSTAAGVAGVAEGIIDLGIAFGADITGNHDYAEYVFKDNVVGDWHEDLTEDFNPDQVVKFGGDVLHGLGQSSWFLLSLIPGAQWLGPTVFGAGMVGQGISSAAEQTGDVGVKEVAYGATTAALETGLEAALGGMGNVAKSGALAIAELTGKSTFKKIASGAVRKGLLRKLFSSAASEFAEEFISEYADTFLQRAYKINPGAEYSLTNALYAGTVGAVSGGVSAGSVDVISTTAHQQRGAKIIKNGNAQTVVNTANYVADKLAASGTNFKNAAEWIRTLRGEVDAYNKLSPEAKQGLRGQTILGEMQASLYFAETQAIHSGLVNKIQNESEENRAAMAEYINKNIDKKNRPRDYTADDIAADTDEIAKQLAIMNMSGTTFFNFESAMADMAQESGIESVIEKERSVRMQTEEPADAEVEAKSVIENDAEVKYSIANTFNMSWEDQLKKSKRSDTLVASKNTPSYLTEKGVSDKPLAIPKSIIKKAQSGKDESHSISDKNVRDLTKGIDNAIAVIDDKNRNSIIFITNLTEKGKPIIVSMQKDASFDGDDVHKATSIHVRQNLQAYLQKFDADSIIVLKQNELDALSRNDTHNGVRVQEGEKLVKKSIPQKSEVVNTESKKNIVKHDLTESAAKTAQEASEAFGSTVKSETAEKVTESKDRSETAKKSTESKDKSSESEKKTAEPKISIAKEILTESERTEKAQKQADNWIEWEKKTAPTAEELNKAREYFKEFDSINNRRRLAILRTIRSAEGVDAKTVKGIANLMAVIPGSDLEVRFSDGVGPKGLITKVGNKTVIVIDSSTNRKNTIKGTIAHELTHYLENKAGYEQLAKFARDHAKPETIEKHKNKYIKFWNEIGHDYTQAELDSEITASLVADALNNERFLKRYADRDKTILQRAGSWLKDLVTRLKKKGKETEDVSEIADEMAHKLIVLLQSDKTTGESKSGVKYSAKELYVQDFSEDEIERYYKTGKTGHAIHKKSDTKDLTGSAVLVGDSEIDAFIREAVKESKNINKGYAVIPKALSDKIAVSTDNHILTENWFLELSSDDLFHLYREHHTAKDVGDLDMEIEELVSLPKKIDGTADFLGVERVKTQTKIKLGVKTESGGHYIVVELVSKDSQALRLKNAWKVSKEKYDAIKKEEPATTHNRTNNSPAISDDTSSSINSIPQKSDLSTPFEKKYDLADDAAEEKAEKKPDDTLNENGEVKDEYFAAAVSRMQQGTVVNPETRQERAERMIETRKTNFNKLLRQAATIQRKLEKLKKAADKSSNASEVKKLQKEYREIMMRLEDHQRELREMGYDLNAESRLIERQQKQIEAQGEVIADLRRQKRELEELEREDRIMRELDKREAARAAKMVAELRAEMGKVYNKTEVRRYIDEIFERGLISQFFGGEYRPELSTSIKNDIAQYIAMQLNLLGTSEGARAQNIIFTATNDIVKRITFTDAESGDTLHLDKVADEETVKRFSEFIEADLINMFQNVGTLNPYAELRRRYELVRAEYLDKSKQAKERQELGKELPKTYQAALKIKRLAAQGKGSFSEAVQLVADELGKMVDESGHLHFGRIDAAMGEVARFFEAEAMKAASERDQLGDKAKVADDGVVWSVNPALQEKVEEYLRLRKGREGKALTAEELKLVGEVLRGMKTTIERYNKEFINGHWVDVETIASETVADLLDFVVKDKEYKTKIGKILGGKLGKTIDQGYFYYILSPETVIEALEGYKQGGLLKSLYHSVRVAKQRAEHRAVQMKKHFTEFIDNKENRWEAKKDQGGREGKSYSYRDKLNVRKISVNGTEITLGEAIYLLMLTKREHAHAGLLAEGFITYDENNKQREKVRVDDIPRVRDLIYNQLDKTDLKFLEMAEEFFNKTATKVKEDADMVIFGFTNTQEGYYVPIIRDRYSRMGGVTDARQSIGSIITVYNKSFNQNLVQNAKALEGKNIMSIINDHADGLADYAELYLPLKAFDRVYNKVVHTSDGNKSIREILNTQVWNGTETYFKDLFSDIQGQGRKQDKNIDKIVGKARSAWVNSVLGANLKVVATQTTSLGAATQVIEPKYIMPAVRLATPGLKVDEIRERAYKYSDIIETRSFDMGAIRAQGNIEKVSKIGEKSGWAIGWMDERICLAIFHAAELKVQDTRGYAVGTEENARLAAKIADEAIYTTQAMTAASERSAMQRSTSEIAKLFSMFTSDSVKNLSHLYGNTMKYIAHSQRVKAGDTSYQAALETDKKEIRRSLRTLAIIGVMLGLITQAFKYLFAKEEEEPEDKVKDFAIDIASSTLNILPVVSDIVDKFVFNYDMSMNVLDVLNDNIESLSKGFKTMGKQMSGEYVSTKEAAGVTLDIIKSGASMFGIPVAPAERTITGLMRRFTPSLIYGYDAMFTTPSYTADLKDAVENGDEALAEHILSQLYKSEVNGTYTSAELEEIVRLYSLTDEEGKHYNVLPQKIGTEINGVKLTAAQRKQFTKIYSQASGEVNKLISGSYYLALNDEQKAKAIKNIYAMFYNRAANEIAGKEMTTAVAYSYLTSNYQALFASQAYKGGLTEQKDALGNKITVKDQFVDYAANSGLSDSDLLVISYANGVKDKSTRAAFLQYLNSLSLPTEIKAQIADRLGFEVKDGVIVEKTEQ